VKSLKGIRLWVDLGKAEGLVCKSGGNMITEGFIFLKKNMWTASTGPWTEEEGTGVRSIVDRVHTASRASNHGHLLYIQRPREKRARQQWPKVARPGHVLVQSPEGH
jgi:hypothetical protein